MVGRDVEASRPQRGKPLQEVFKRGSHWVVQIASSYPSALEKAAKMVEDNNGPLARMGNARVVLKTILDFGTVVAEVSAISALVPRAFYAWFSTAELDRQAGCRVMYKGLGGTCF